MPTPKKLPLRVDPNARFFEDPDANIYARALIQGHTVLTVPRNGGEPAVFTLIFGADPVELTQLATVDELRRAQSLRLAIAPAVGARGRVPPAVMLMDEEEVIEFYRKRAIRRNYMTPEGEPDIERAMTPAYTAELNEDAPSRIERSSLPPELEDESSEEDNEVQRTLEMHASKVHPRIETICANLNASPDDDRTSAEVTLDELESLGALNDDTLEHLSAKGFYHAVKTWARRQLDLPMDERGVN